MEKRFGKRILKKLSELPKAPYISTQIIKKTVMPYYTKKSLLIGYKINKYTGAEKKVWLPLMRHDSISNRYEIMPSIMTICGARGAGKTILLKRILEAFYYSGYHVCHISDIKNEMVDSIYPNERLAHLLPEEDKPRGLPIKSYKPYFFHTMNGEELPEDNEWISIPFSSLNEETFFSTFNFKNSDHRKDIIYKYFPGCESIIDFKKRLISSDENARVKNSIIKHVDVMIHHKFFSEEYERSFVEDMKKGLIPVLNLQGYETINPIYYQLYLKIILQQIKEAKINGELKKPVVIFIDEASKMIPKKGESKGKSEIMWQIDVTRRYGMFYVLASQEPEDMPEKIIVQSKYVFIPYNYDSEKLKPALKRKGFYNSRPEGVYGYNWWFDKKKEMAYLNRKFGKGRRVWMLLDTDENRFTIFFAYPCMCGHE